MASRSNPRIGEIEVGIREVKKLRIYPLSLGQQFEVSDLIAEALEEFFKQKAGDINQQVVSFLFSFLKDNIQKVLAFIVDPRDLESLGFATVNDLLYDVDNEQLQVLFMLVKEKNFDSLLKNLKGPLLGIMRGTEVLEELKNTEVEKRQRGPLTDPLLESVDSTRPIE